MPKRKKVQPTDGNGNPLPLKPGDEGKYRIVTDGNGNPKQPLSAQEAKVGLPTANETGEDKGKGKKNEGKVG